MEVTKERIKEESNATLDDKPSKSSGPYKEEDLSVHKVHSFDYRFSFKKYSVTCSKAGTVLESLQRNKVFKKKMETKNPKEIVILKQSKAVSPHFPCCLLSEKQLLTITFIKPCVDHERKQKAIVPSSGIPTSRPLTFSVGTKGGEKIKLRVLRNPVLRQKCEQVIVYAYEGERLKDVLQRDGRFQKTLFQKNCGLYDTTNETTFEMSSLVDALDGRSFQIQLIDGSIVEGSQTSGQEEDVQIPKCSSSADTSNVTGDSSIQNKPSSSHQESEYVSAEEATKNATRSKKKVHAISDSGEVYGILCSQFKDLLKQLKNRHDLKTNLPVQRLFTEEYGKRVETCLEMKRVRQLTTLGGSVCQVRVNGSARGSGFLLFDKFVLTNGHVVKDILNSDMTCKGKVSVTFSFEDLSSTGCLVEVLKVFAFEYGKNALGHLQDMALLELSPEPEVSLPPDLLRNFKPPPAAGGICIIGHPGGGVKKIDPCYIIPAKERNDAMTKHCKENKEFMHLITNQFTKNNWDLEEVMNRDNVRITYDTCFYHGSSGSPVFDEHCNVIAMHSGGFAYDIITGKTQSVIEYALPLSPILQTIIYRAVFLKRGDVLWKVLDNMNSEGHQVLKDMKCVIDLFPEVYSEIFKTVEETSLTYYDFLFDRDEPMVID